MDTKTKNKIYSINAIVVHIAPLAYLPVVMLPPSNMVIKVFWDNSLKISFFSWLFFLILLQITGRKQFTRLLWSLSSFGLFLLVNPLTLTLIHWKIHGFAP